jgi:hypothetical protein
LKGEQSARRTRTREPGEVASISRPALTPSSHAEPTEVLTGEGDAHGKVKARSHLETPRSRGAKAMEAKLSFPTGENHD